MLTNTGGPPAGRVDLLTDAQWKTGIDSTLLSVHRMCHLAVPSMKEKQQGSIVHLTSLVAARPNPLLAISSTLRAGLNALTQLQALEWAAFGIRVNALLPGHTETDRQLHLLEVRSQQQHSSVEEEKKKSTSKIPMGRFAKPDEIADVAAFLFSSQSSYVTGAAILVDGGASITGV